PRASPPPRGNVPRRRRPAPRAASRRPPGRRGAVPGGGPVRLRHEGGPGEGPDGAAAVPGPVTAPEGRHCARLRNGQDRALSVSAAPHGAVLPSHHHERTGAVSLTKVQEKAPDLVSLYKAAGASVRSHGLEAVRAAVYLVLDRSGSMRPYYRDGTMQHFAEQVLSLSAHLDDDGTVPVVSFSTD